MGDDSRRDRQQSETGTRTPSSRTPAVHAQARADSSRDDGSSEGKEFEIATEPRGRTLEESDDDAHTYKIELDVDDDARTQNFEVDSDARTQNFEVDSDARTQNFEVDSDARTHNLELHNQDRMRIARDARRAIAKNPRSSDARLVAAKPRSLQAPSSHSRIATSGPPTARMAASALPPEANAAESASRISVRPEERPAQQDRPAHADSLQPVRVPDARQSQRPPSIWSRTWATFALVFVVAGGAIGVVTGLRARSVDTESRRLESLSRDRAHAGFSSGASPEPRGSHGAAPSLDDLNVPATAIPAAAPGITAPSPIAPVPTVQLQLVRSASAPPVVSAEREKPELPKAVNAEVGNGVVVNAEAPRNSNIAPPPVIASSSGRHMTTGPSVSRPREPEIVKNSKPVSPAPDEPSAPKEPKEKPSPEPPGTSEAWVTEERRF